MMYRFRGSIHLPIVSVDGIESRRSPNWVGAEAPAPKHQTITDNHAIAIIVLYHTSMVTYERWQGRGFKKLPMPDLDLIKQVEQGCGTRAGGVRSGRRVMCLNSNKIDPSRSTSLSCEACIKASIVAASDRGTFFGD